MKNDLRYVGMRFVVAGMLALASLSALADSYTWVGAVNADWLTASNWSPADPAFANTVNDICDVNSGGQPQIKTSGQTLYGRLNLQAGAILGSVAYRNTTISNLYLNGGKLAMNNGDNVGGKIVVTSNSEVWSGTADNNGISSTISGSANLLVVNRQPVPQGRNLSFSGDISGYSGVFTVTNATGSPTSFVSVGTGGLKIAGGTKVDVRSSTLSDLEVELGPGSRFGTSGSASPINCQGTITVLSYATLRAAQDYNNKHFYINGEITGEGRISLTHVDSTHKVILNHSNSHGGGTIVNDNRATANVAGSLGTGNLQVMAGAAMEIKATGVLAPTAGIYLDLSGVSTGKLDLATSTTTTVAAVRTGGSGGWLAPVGYTDLPAGSYTATTLPGYLTGAGTLVVAPIAAPGTLVIFR